MIYRHSAGGGAAACERHQPGDGGDPDAGQVALINWGSNSDSDSDQAEGESSSSAAEALEAKKTTSLPGEHLHSRRCCCFSSNGGDGRQLGLLHPLCISTLPLAEVFCRPNLLAATPSARVAPSPATRHDTGKVSLICAAFFLGFRFFAPHMAAADYHGQAAAAVATQLTGNQTN